MFGLEKLFGNYNIVDKNGDYITVPDKSYKQVSLKTLKLVRHNNNWQYVIA